MIWTDLTDALFCNAFGHLFVIHKEPKLGVITWAVIDQETSKVVHEGTTYKVGQAKALMKTLYKDLKASNVFYRKKNNKLVRRK